MTSVAFNISIVADMEYEEDESFRLIIAGGSLPSKISRGNPSNITVTIIDVTSKLLAFSQMLHAHILLSYSYRVKCKL